MRTIFSFLAFAVLLGSCEKADLKKPVKVNFAFDLNKNFEPQAAVKLTTGTINIENFNIIGDRVEGEDINFNRVFNEGLNIDVNNSGEIDELNFDLPQGDYVSADLKFNLADKNTNLAMSLEGTYKQNQGPIVKLIFELSGSQEFFITGEGKQGESTISMKESEGEKVEIELDPIYWFEDISASDWDNAVVTPAQGQDYILVNKDNNQTIYNQVLARINESNRAIFD
ncbi:hypothetical protein K6119_10275 [Paracrocinitomix mangrovi]|uniref:hypothetical protein n=1 Tax=Paracrocinitomix mangrovi TaxID=2862509 RepID=UPI001C8D5827|nr:hypothetical protein [Paracrocinitomix mangrovi]UKN00119.1 hypothetical protein K6119_10275 [Paracrocinitomix mangrovi]